MYGISSAEIHLWVKRRLLAVVFKVDETIRKFGFKENEKNNSVIMS
jgi:hypothetical protein